MTHYFLESSALAKLFIYETGSDSLVRLLEQVTDTQRIASSLAFLEIRSAIRRREREGDISAQEATDSLHEVTAEAARVIQQPVSPTVLSVASDAMDEHPLRCLDALHLATCLVARNDLKLSDIYFVSSDRALITAAVAEGLQVLDPLIL